MLAAATPSKTFACQPKSRPGIRTCRTGTRLFDFLLTRSSNGPTPFEAVDLMWIVDAFVYSLNGYRLLDAGQTLSVRATKLFIWLSPMITLPDDEKALD